MALNFSEIMIWKVLNRLRWPPIGAENVQAIPTAHPLLSISISRPSFEKNAEYWQVAVIFESSVATMAPMCTNGPWNLEVFGCRIQHLGLAYLFPYGKSAAHGQRQANHFGDQCAKCEVVVHFEAMHDDLDLGNPRSLENTALNVLRNQRTSEHWSKSGFDTPTACLETIWQNTAERAVSITTCITHAKNAR